jgi:hypothetical protein
MVGYRAGLPAIESALTSVNVALLYRQHVLHPIVSAIADKARGENNTEEEE